MTQTVGIRRTIIITSIVVMILLISLVAALIEHNQSATTRIQSATTRINLYLVDNPTDMLQGSSSHFIVLVASIGKAENITLSSNVGLSGINCTFEPTIGTSNFTSTVTLNVPDSTQTGNYTVTVIASGDGQEANVSSVLSVLSANLIAGDIVVSGRANSAELYGPFRSSLISINFTDIVTGIGTSYYFNFPFPPTFYPQGNFSVI